MGAVTFRNLPRGDLVLFPLMYVHALRRGKMAQPVFDGLVAAMRQRLPVETVLLVGPFGGPFEIVPRPYDHAEFWRRFGDA